MGLVAGSGAAEFDKRLGAALMEALPMFFLDNYNGAQLRSDLLASVLTEPLVDVRLLGATWIRTMSRRSSFVGPMFQSPVAPLPALHFS
jgi:hypothetical protein